jgi:hypothetical protein
VFLSVLSYAVIFTSRERSNGGLQDVAGVFVGVAMMGCMWEVGARAARSLIHDRAGGMWVLDTAAEGTSPTSGEDWYRHIYVCTKTPEKKKKKIF